ncbi:MAG: class I SAM-dependent methyltransferase [Arenicellales bacterium]|nr:class I SAM-dependent methyltransferase [Arenicellales bacterium]MDP6552611.1 class I SAM-dependent methyltransferase [Arenicellales bacterium]MDP6919774.1 class I SAM-dependent methyltransferase [Arenicellales bacterium]
MEETGVARSYRAETLEEQQAAYDSWAKQYEIDLCAMGYRIPAVIAAVSTRFIPSTAAPILDAGCGGGIQAEALAMLGFGPITGIDLSEGMLEVARTKGIYSDLRQMTLGEKLDFADNTFAAVISSGTITPHHAPPGSFEELIRVAKPGAPIVFSLRDDPAQEPEYPEAVKRLTDAGLWREAFTTESFHSMPYGEPQITHRVHVYQVS